MLKEFRVAATLQKIVTKLSQSTFNTGKNWVVTCILSKSRGCVLKNFLGGVRPQIPESCSTYSDSMSLSFSINFR